MAFLTGLSLRITSIEEEKITDMSVKETGLRLIGWNSGYGRLETGLRTIVNRATVGWNPGYGWLKTGLRTVVNRATVGCKPGYGRL